MGPFFRRRQVTVSYRSGGYFAAKRRSGLCVIVRTARGAPIAETRKLAPILVGDIVGFSRLAGADEDRILARLRTLRRLRNVLLSGDVGREDRGCAVKATDPLFQVLRQCGAIELLHCVIVCAHETRVDPCSDDHRLLAHGNGLHSSA
jgi:hypothetical protein